MPVRGLLWFLTGFIMVLFDQPMYHCILDFFIDSPDLPVIMVILTKNSSKICNLCDGK